MKSLSVIATVMGFLVAQVPSSWSAPQTSPAPPVASGATSAPAIGSGSGPRIQFQSTTHNFGKVLAGQPVKCEFIFTNTGDATLEVTAVNPGCRCTVAGTWTHQVEPGKTGVIPLQLETAAFGGQTVTRAVSVTSNAKNQPMASLQLTGTFWRPVEVSPPTAVLNVVADAPSNAPVVVRIVSSLDEPITLSEPESNNPGFAAALKTIRPGKEFELIVRTVPPLNQGMSQAAITMKTSSTNVPTISVNAYATVQPVIAVRPPQVMLPPNPITNAFSAPVTILNNGVNPLTLSDATVNTNGVDVKVKEVLPGRQFTITLTFPAGFEIAPDRRLELSVKTSNPQSPLIKVPLRQIPRAVRPLPIPPPPPAGVAPAPPAARS